MDPHSKSDFFSVCATVAILLAIQTGFECAAPATEFVSSHARVVVPPFVDRRRGRKEWTSRNTFQRKDYKDNHWWRMVEGRLHHDIRTTDGRDFRNNFRIPASFFDRLVTWFKDSGWNVREWDKWGRASVPLELKILATFEMLGRGVPAAVPAGLIGCDSKTIKNFYHLFCRKVALHLKDLHIKFPSNIAEIRACVATYAEENLPGCLGSIDCVHVPWPKALASQRSWFVGKEGIPTVAFQVIVNHKRKILSVSRPHPGSHNDKCIASMDPALHSIRTLQLFITFAWQACTAVGSATIHGVYLICDGGYHFWRVLQRCNAVTSEPKQLFLMNRIASARKDVECTFGIMKSRFRILKTPMLDAELSNVDDVFTTCAIFHNMLLDHDSADFEDHGLLDAATAARSGVSRTADHSGVSRPPAGYWLGSHPEATHLKLRMQLSEHLYYSNAAASSPAPRSNVPATPNTVQRRY